MSTEKSMTATVTVVSPLTIIADGAATANLAIKAADLAALTVGDRVSIIARDPIMPLVVGVEVPA